MITKQIKLIIRKEKGKCLRNRGGGCAIKRSIHPSAIFLRNDWHIWPQASLVNPALVLDDLSAIAADKLIRADPRSCVEIDSSTIFTATRNNNR